MNTTVNTVSAAATLAASADFDFSKVNVESLKLALIEAELNPGNLGVKKLVAMAQKHDITIPMIGESQSSETPDSGTVAEAQAEGGGEAPEAQAEGGGEAQGEKTPEPEAKVSRNVVPQKYRQRYGAAQNNGDKVAKILADVTKNKDGSANSAAIAAVAEANGIDFGKYSHLNVGMQRMNVGNVLRGKLNKGEKVVIGETIFEARDTSADDGKTASKV